MIRSLRLLQAILPCNWTVYNEPVPLGHPQEFELALGLILDLQLRKDSKNQKMIDWVVSGRLVSTGWHKRYDLRFTLQNNVVGHFGIKLPRDKGIYYMLLTSYYHYFSLNVYYEVYFYIVYGIFRTKANSPLHMPVGDVIHNWLVLGQLMAGAPEWCRVSTFPGIRLHLRRTSLRSWRGMPDSQWSCPRDPVNVKVIIFFFKHLFWKLNIKSGKGGDHVKRLGPKVEIHIIHEQLICLEWSNKS